MVFVLLHIVAFFKQLHSIAQPNRCTVCQIYIQNIYTDRNRNEDTNRQSQTDIDRQTQKQTDQHIHRYLGR